MFTCSHITHTNCIVGTLCCIIATICYQFCIFIYDVESIKFLKLQIYPITAYVLLISDVYCDHQSWECILWIACCRSLYCLSIIISDLIIWEKRFRDLFHSQYQLMIFVLVVGITLPESHMFHVNFIRGFVVICLSMVALKDFTGFFASLFLALLIGGPIEYHCDECKWVEYMSVILTTAEKIYVLHSSEHENDLQRNTDYPNH